PYLRCHLWPRLSITRSWPVIPPGGAVNTEHLRWGVGLLCLLKVLLSVGSGTLLWMASSVITVKPPHTTPFVKHSLHTVNPLITPHVNPFLPSAISIVSVFFFLALITLLVSLGMSVKSSQFPPVSECPLQF
ncbi:unnamed protein product, partial [Staurois parvus]